MNTVKLFSSHATALSAPSSESPTAPKWIQLLPAGRFTGRDGRGPYRVDDSEAVIVATREYFGNADIPLDYNHQTERTAENGKPAPAAGWIKKLESRGDGLWGQVEWTEAGARAVEAKEFRYVSPVFFHDALGRVLMIQSAALTNLPNLDLKALSSQAENSAENSGAKEYDMNFKEAMAQSLGLSLDARETEIIAAAQAARDAITHAGKALNASEGLAGLIRAAQETASKAARADNPDPGRFVPMSMHESVSRELAALKAEQAKAHAEALVKAAQSAGKLTPAMEAWGTSYAAADPKGFKAWMETAPDLRPGGGRDSGTSSAPPDKGAPALNETEKAVCAAFDLSEDDYRKAEA